MKLTSVIDADTHVDETEATWEYMPPEDQRFKPIVDLYPNPDAAPDRPQLRDWVVEGIRTRRVVRNDAKSGTKLEARELLDVATRLRHMDELGTEIQVIYPTFFLHVPASTPEAQIALARSYNRWLAGPLRRVQGSPALGVRAPARGLGGLHRRASVRQGPRGLRRLQERGRRGRPSAERPLLLPHLRGGGTARHAHLLPHRQRQPGRAARPHALRRRRPSTGSTRCWKTMCPHVSPRSASAAWSRAPHGSPSPTTSCAASTTAMSSPAT